MNLTTDSFDVYTATTQEMCDYAVKKIVEQGGRCMGDVSCAYGDAQGNHCAVGWLIPDGIEYYNLVMEYAGAVDELIDEEYGALPDQLVEVFASNMLVLDKLQAFHDLRFRGERDNMRQSLQGKGIDTSGDHWQAWVDMSEITKE